MTRLAGNWRLSTRQGGLILYHPTIDYGLDLSWGASLFIEGTSARTVWISSYWRLMTLKRVPFPHTHTPV